MAIQLPEFVGPSFEAHWREGQLSSDYHADNSAVSSTRLKRILKSPANFYSTFIQDEEDELTRSDSLRFGSAFHLAILEPKLFFKSYVKMPEFKGVGSQAAKAEWLGAQPKGTVLVTEKEMIMLEGMVNSVLSHRDASALLKHGQAEVSGYYRDPETGIKCRFRPDFINFELLTLIDVKTTTDASAEAFSRTIWNYRYDIQMAMYCTGTEQILGKWPHYPIFLAVEKAPPYEVAVYVADELVLNVGRESYRECMRRVAECLKLNKWPAMQTSLQPISLPAWALR